MGERYTPREQDVLGESRKITDDKRKEKGAQEVKDGRVEFTADQVQQAKDEMEGAKKHGKENPVDTALGIKLQKMNSDLLPVWNEMRALKDKLPHEMGKNLAEFEGKQYFGGSTGELAKLRDQKEYIKTYKTVHPDEESADLSRFEELLGDPKLEEYWRTKQEQEAVRDQK